jgi:predicted small secreted protein
MKYTIAVILCALSLAACNDESGQGREARQTQLNMNQASTIVGMPAITNFTEKRQLKTIYELRDSARLVTYSYIIDLNGKRHRVCPSTSVGFGIPYAAQYTAPKTPKIGYPVWPDGTQGGAHTYDAEQPEPNGLYMPASAEGTWVLCLHPNGKDLAPTYVEPRVVVYTFEMPAAD